jgi:lysophospholipase L1-like esterase
MKLIKLPFTIIIVLCVFSSFRDKQLTWVAIGDSITYLNDHVNETGNRVTKGYLTRVTESFSDLTYINKGYNGWTSGMIADHIDSLGLTKADIYTVFLGTNDWWQGRPIGTLADYKANKGNSSLCGSFRIIINKIRTLNPEAKIVLITPMHRADFVYINDPKNTAYGSYKPKNGQYLEQFVAAIDSIGNYENVPVIDLYHNQLLSESELVNFKRLKNPATGTYVDYKFPESTTIPFNPSQDEYPYPKEAINLTFDGLHPSDKGNAVIAQAVIKAFRQIEPKLQ